MYSYMCKLYSNLWTPKSKNCRTASVHSQANQLFREIPILPLIFLAASRLTGFYLTHCIFNLFFIFFNDNKFGESRSWYFLERWKRRKSIVCDISTKSQVNVFFNPREEVSPFLTVNSPSL